MPDPIEISDWQAFWAESFRSKARVLRAALGELALRIDHVGSTAVEGLAAKPIIDIQVSVRAFEPIAPLVHEMQRAGYEWREANAERTKRYFRERPGAERTHVHVRTSGSWNEQGVLLLRDYLRAHAEERAAYAALKRELASRFRDERAAYGNGKSDFVWAALRRADEWAKRIGWAPGASDA